MAGKRQGEVQGAADAVFGVPAASVDVVKQRLARLWGGVPVHQQPEVVVHRVAGGLQVLAPQLGTDIDEVLEFRVSQEELFQRLKGRGRADDTDDVIRNRMKVYRDETAPLLEYYSDQLKTVDAVGSVDEVFARALHALGK